MRMLGPLCAAPPRRIATSVIFLAISLTPMLSPAQSVIDLSTYTEGLRINGSQMGDSFGSFVRRCDVNGDGIPDAVISAHEAAGPGNTRGLAGEAYIVYGARKRRSGVTTIDALRDVIVYGRTAGDNLTWGTACGDVNGDGYDDLVLGAYSADSAAGQRQNAGQVHVAFGGPTLPPVIDLAVSPYVTIWGAEANSGTARNLSVGDLNGDGIDDIGIASRNGSGKGGAPLETGRAYVVFGRTSWPVTVDLLDQANIVVYGAAFRDYLGSAVQIIDLDRDGVAELVVAAERGSGPGDVRAASGDIYVFAGRSIWPAEFNMATTSPTTWIFGPDTFDSIVGSNRALHWGDVDGDGSQELIIGIPNGDGPTNGSASTGECRLAEFSGSIQTTIDLRDDSRAAVFGVAATERFGNGVQLADVNGDGLDDLWIDSLRGDGPSETRTDAGEVHILFGRPAFPAVVDLGVTSPDLLIYGALNFDEIALATPLDLNGDGFLDIGIRTGDALATRLESLWYMNPFDFDGDGVTQLQDNCPLVANGNQSDANGDGRGDACAFDWDGDGQDDSTDCAPANAASGTPETIGNVMFAAASKSTLRWSPTQFSDRYDVSRGELPSTSASDYGACQNALDSNRTDTEFVDLGTPLGGQAWFYLVRGHSDLCALAGSWGTTSTGAERVNSNPAGCP